jgi:dephospho-CoA kinase|tara:strand:+ start:1456 stop:2106 length:651 start_codon:yes stop_codon:yes gene_type:complete
MSVVALTGGVAAGKSTVTEVLRGCGAFVIDADQLAREAVVPGSAALEAIVARFGSNVLLDSGELNRAGLGSLVFGNPEALADLNAIVHPQVRALYGKAVSAALGAYPDRVLVYDVPLLAEARSAAEFDLVVVVDTPAEQRVSRLMDQRGLSLEEATARVAAQATDAQRLAHADVVLDSSQSLAQTKLAARALYDALKAAWPAKLDTVARMFPSSAS